MITKFIREEKSKVTGYGTAFIGISVNVKNEYIEFDNEMNRIFRIRGRLKIKPIPYLRAYTGYLLRPFL